MVCRLCLTECSDTIEIFSKEKIQSYILKFLQLELSTEDPVSKVICVLCWQELENFQKFHFRIAEAQKTLIAACETLKEELIVNASEEQSPEGISFEHVNSELNLNLLKKEDTGDMSDDEPCDNTDDFHCLDEDPVQVKVEQRTDVCQELVVCSLSHAPPNQRITRGSKRKLQSTPEKGAEEKLRKKRGRPRKEKLEDQQSDVKPEQDNKEENEALDDKNIPVDVNAKKKRGRPKKGEEKPKIPKVRSEKVEKIMEAVKEFDEIIQKNMNLSCNICTARLIDFADLKRHFRSVHNRKGYAVCCNKRLYKRPLVVDHINTHLNPEHFKCTECGKVMADRMCLRNHVLLFHQNEVDKTYQCSYCPKKYAKQYLLDHHQVKHIPQEECSHICGECGKGFPTKSTLNQHVNQTHSTVYDKMCEVCAKLIRGNAAFERHMDEHEGIVRPQVQCEICGSWLKDKNSLRKHMYGHDGKTYPCNLCDKIAPSKSALQSHQRYVHRAERTFHCTFCEKAFKKAVNLKEHLTTHTGDVLYTCPHCPRTFNSKANMHAHRKRIHRVEWEAGRRNKQLTSNETKSA